MKKNFIKMMFGAMVIVTVITSMSLNKDDKNDVILSNIETLALASGEGGGSGSWTCYSSYDACSFWCDVIYRCGNPCPTVECDDQWDKSACSAI